MQLLPVRRFKAVTAKLQTRHPEAFMVISEDFNHATLDSTLAAFHQLVGKQQHPSLHSDHNLVHQQPRYTP